MVAVWIVKTEVSGARNDACTYSMADNEHGLYHRRIYKYSDTLGIRREQQHARAVAVEVGGAGTNIPRLIPDSVVSLCLHAPAD